MVKIPDLHGCVTEGFSLADALLMAADVIGLWISYALEEGQSIPKASDPSEIEINPDEPESSIHMVAIDMDEYLRHYGRKVRKSVVLPAWFNTWAEQNEINCSKTLRNALKAMYDAQLDDEKS